MRGYKEAPMKRTVLLAAVITMVLFAGQCFGAPAGKVSKVEGRVDVLKTGKNVVTPVSAGDAVDVGDIYRAKSGAAAEILFLNGNLLKIGQASRVEIKEHMVEGDKSSSKVRLYRGKVQAVAGQDFLKKAAAIVEGNRFEVETPNAVAGIRGTNMVVFYERGIGGTMFIEGHGYVYNPLIPDQIMTVQTGYISFVMGRNVLPTFPRKATPAELKAQVNLVVHAKTMDGTTGTGETPQDFFVGTGTARAVGSADLPKEILTPPPGQQPGPAGGQNTPAPYVPPAEVATARLSGSLIEGGQGNLDYVNIFMDVSMFKTTSNGSFKVWKTNSLSGDYKFGDYLTPGTIVQPGNYLVLSDGRLMEVDFQFIAWVNGMWEASVDGSLSGKANGTYTGIESGDISGQGSGTVTAAAARQGLSGAPSAARLAAAAKMKDFGRIKSGEVLKRLALVDLRNQVVMKNLKK
jgi:hypothetical protein